jgi:hypothetical protein
MAASILILDKYVHTILFSFICTWVPVDRTHNKVNLSSIFRHRIKWSCDGSLANQMSVFVYPYIFCYESPFYSPWKRGS